MLLPLRPATGYVLRAQYRTFHTSPRRRHLVAAPDPISHMRPILYEDVPTPTDSSKSSPPTLVRHPYSLTEFSDTLENNNASDLELQFKLQRQQLDAFHHNFWLDSNSRFEAAKEAILSALPETATVLDKESTLSEFYKQWVMQEKARTDAYTTEWRSRNWALIFLETRVRFGKLKRLFLSS